MQIKGSFHVGSMEKHTILIMKSGLTSLVCEGQIMTSGLIKDHSYLIMHKFMSHIIFERKDSTRDSPDELFMLWCLKTNTKVYSTYFVLCSMWRVVQARKALLSMGHIITGLAMYFTSFELDKHQLEPLEVESLDEDYIVRAEITMKFNEFHDVTSR